MFRYGLEPLLRHRKTLEDEQQRSLATANRHYLAETGKIRELESEQRHTMEKMTGAISNIKNSATFFIYDNYMAGSKSNLQKTSEKAEQIKQIVDMEREALIEKVKSRKVIELHRQRTKDRYLKEEARKELAMYDEISVQRHQRKKGLL
ncbi:hypothetical protein MNBD_NITROSPINAE01-883 [hydrothermal vent metagenome]|uniref:Flagellar FliJ protein n=1 Tax=hydrothermal vent metagenome TaxID=652676 RepID=A0A3B1D0P7_9ZZZZ